jgi:hypothetical protein
LSVRARTGEIVKGWAGGFCALTEQHVINGLYEEREYKKWVADKKKSDAAGRVAQRAAKKDTKAAELKSLAAGAWCEAVAATDNILEYLRTLKQASLRKICRWAHWQAQGVDDAKELGFKRDTPAADKLTGMCNLIMAHLDAQPATIPARGSDGRWRLPASAEDDDAGEEAEEEAVWGDEEQWEREQEEMERSGNAAAAAAGAQERADV